MPRNLPYNRADRVAKQVYQVIASFFYKEVDDARLKGVQITDVKMTKDLSIARVYFFIAGEKKIQNEAKLALEGLAPELKHTIGNELLLKIMPKLEFFADEGTKNAMRVEEILEKIHAHD